MRECVGAYEDARRPSDGVNVMGELSIDRPLKSHGPFETGEIMLLLLVYGLDSRYGWETGRA